MDEKSKLLTIGQFAALHGINKKTLMWYDEIGLFKPVAVNPVNGYRCYNYYQSPILETILLLRELDVSITEIQDFIKNRSAEAMRNLLDEKIGELDLQIMHLQAVKKTLCNHHQNMTALLTMDLSEITVVEKEECCLVTVNIDKDTAFEQEVERLSHICMSDGKETNLVLEDNRHFPADAYICEYNWNHCYEYALVFPEALKINYIFLQNIDAADAAFEDSLLPEGYGEESEENPYCLYAFGTGKNVIWYE